MGKADFEFGMFPEIADGANAEFLGAIPAHDQGISVVEPERFGHPDAEFFQSIPDFHPRLTIAPISGFPR